MRLKSLLCSEEGFKNGMPLGPLCSTLHQDMGTGARKKKVIASRLADQRTSLVYFWRKAACPLYSDSFPRSFVSRSEYVGKGSRSRKTCWADQGVNSLLWVFPSLSGAGKKKNPLLIVYVSHLLFLFLFLIYILLRGLLVPCRHEFFPWHPLHCSHVKAIDKIITVERFVGLFLCFHGYRHQLRHFMRPDPSLLIALILAHPSY